MKALIKKILPSKLVKLIAKIKFYSHYYILAFFSRSEFLSSIFYLFFSREFSREHHSVLLGRLKYLKRNTFFTSGYSSLLRRNIHRLEKGLIMQPRKKIFAEDYIQQTVSAYRHLLRSPKFCSNERQWANDVLFEYFSVVDESPKISKAKQIFFSLDKLEIKNNIPYDVRDRIRSDITVEQLENLFIQRRSIRWYESKTVEDHKLDIAINMASYAPSACNRQPYKFYVVNGNNSASKVAKLAVGTKGFYQNIQCVVAIVGDLSEYQYERDRHLIYIDGSLAAMQFMLAMEAQGLSTCPLNWPDIAKNDKSIAGVLKLKGQQRVIMLIAVGYPQLDGKIPYSQKKQSDVLKVSVNA